MHVLAGADHFFGEEMPLEKSGFVECHVFEGTLKLGDLAVTAIRVPDSNPPVFIYVFVKQGRRIVYAPCDIRPFPEYRPEVRNPDLLLMNSGGGSDSLVRLANQTGGRMPFFTNDVSVPYRALLPAGLDGILVTGLGASAHRDAMPVIRMQPDIQNGGYAGYVNKYDELGGFLGEMGVVVRVFEPPRIAR